MNKQERMPDTAASAVLAHAPLQRRARAWHALAALRAQFQRPAMQLFAGADAAPSPYSLAGQGEAQVPAHLLAPQPSAMD